MNPFRSSPTDIQSPRSRMRGYAVIAWPGAGADSRHAEETLGTISWSAAAGFCLVYLLLGLTGHDPWKQDEAYIFGIIQSLLETGDWVVPTLTGVPFMEKPPLFYMVAAACARLASPWLPLHDGARIASGLFTGLAVICTGLTARVVWGAGTGRLAALALCASIGLMQHAHMMLTDVALLAGFAVAMLGLTTVRQAPPGPGLLLGTGAGMAFLAKGLLGPGVIALAALLLPMTGRTWRTRPVFRNYLAAVVAAAPWLVIWPLALYLRSPELFSEWFWDNNIGRFLGFSVATLGAASEPGFWWSTLPWFTFPALPLAIWCAARRDIRARMTATVAAPAVLAATFLLVLASAASARASYALPLLAPLAALAAPAVIAVPRRADQGLIALAVVLLLPITAYAWAVWLAAIGMGHVPDWPMLAQYLPMDQVMEIDATSIGLAIGLLLGFAWMVRARALAPARPVAVWAGAFLLAWGTLVCLWMPWIDRARSYRSVFAEVASHLPANACLAADGVGESERAMLRYTTGVMPEIVSRHHGAACDQVLVQGHSGDLSPLVPYRAHVLLWEGARPGDRRERFWLLSRAVNVATNDDTSRGHE